MLECSAKWSGGLTRRAAFPLHELYIAIAILALIAAGLYFLTGAWGVVLLWSLGALLLLPLVGAPLALVMVAKDRAGEKRWQSAGLHALGALVTGAAWLTSVGYTLYRAYRALP